MLSQAYQLSIKIYQTNNKKETAKPKRSEFLVNSPWHKSTVMQLIHIFKSILTFCSAIRNTCLVQLENEILRRQFHWHTNVVLSMHWNLEHRETVVKCRNMLMIVTAVSID